VVRAEHHLAMLEELGAWVQLVDAGGGERMFPDQEAEFDWEVGESGEAFGEFVADSCAKGGDWFGRRG